MDLDLNEEQKLLAKAAREFLKVNSPKTFVRRMEDDDSGFSMELWKEMASLAWMGCVIPEEYGGIGGNFLDLTVLLEEMGRACLPGPFFSTVVLGAMTLLDAGNADQKNTILPKVSSGDSVLTMALTELTGTWEAKGIATRAKIEGDSYVISGTKLFVPDAHVADWMICVARTAEGAKPEDGITLFLVDSRSPGISTTLLRTIASDKQCQVVFERVRVPARNVIGEVGKGWDIIRRTLRKAAVAKCAEMVGGAQQVLEMTVDYAKERVQFDRHIGSFQAVQHHCANMATDVDGCRLITYQAAWMLSKGFDSGKEVAMAKAWVSDAYRRVCVLGHQVHGGIGYTRDHDMQLYYRRAKAAELAYGDADFQRELVAAALKV